MALARWCLAAAFAAAGSVHANGRDIPLAGGDAVPAPVSSADIVYGQLLARYVRGDRLAYAEWRRSPNDGTELRRVIESWQAEGAPSDSTAALARWINVYNALTLDAVLAHYPIESIRAIYPDDPERVWKEPSFLDGDRRLSLNDIEAHVREASRDPRVHFVLCCASIGCPPLRGEPYRGDRLEEQLEEATQRAVGDDRWVRFEGRTLVLSKIFEWYRQDFERDGGSVASFLVRHRQARGKDAEHLRAAAKNPRFAEYDWSLNDEKER